MIGLKVSINGGQPVVCAAEDLAVLTAGVDLCGPLGRLTAIVNPGAVPKCRASAGGLTRRAVGQQDEYIDWLDQRVLAVGDTVTIEVIATDSPCPPVRREPAEEKPGNGAAADDRPRAGDRGLAPKKLDAPALIDLVVSIYIASKTRWAHLEKSVRLPAVPRVGEWLKLDNADMGDYFAWRVVEVTYRESGGVEIMTDLLEDIAGRGYSFEDEAEFDACFRSCQASGWTAPRGIKANTRYKGSGDAPPGAFDKE